MTTIVIKSIEELDERHERELKHLESNLTGASKKSAKKQRETMRKRHEEEKAKLLFSESDEIELDKLTLSSDKEEEPDETPTEAEEANTEPKLSKTAKRRVKKAQQEKDRHDRLKAAMKESEERFLAGERSPKQVELAKVGEYCKDKNLKIVDIRSDGDCLYASIAYQMCKKTDPAELRQIAADTIKSSPDDYVGFLESDIDHYCHQLINENVWGGQVEIIALSRALNLKIRVIQAESPNVLEFGESDAKTMITIVYYRHKCSLGEHYDSTTTTNTA